MGEEEGREGVGEKAKARNGGEGTPPLSQRDLNHKSMTLPCNGVARDWEGRYGELPVLLYSYVGPEREEPATGRRAGSSARGGRRARRRDAASRVRAGRCG